MFCRCTPESLPSKSTIRGSKITYGRRKVGKQRHSADAIFDMTRYRNKEGGCQRNLLTIGAKITSSYARNPYFSAGASGRRTTKSYRFNATSLFIHMTPGMKKDRVNFFCSRSKDHPTPHFHRDSRSGARADGKSRTSRRVVILDFKSSMTFQSYDRAKSRSRYGKPILSNRTHRNSVISFPPTFRRILSKGGILKTWRR